MMVGRTRGERLAKAFIPAANGHLGGLAKVNEDFLGFVQENNPEHTATLDMDATLVVPRTRSIKRSYRGVHHIINLVPCSVIDPFFESLIQKRAGRKFLAVYFQPDRQLVHNLHAS
jgi:hypothetical protein